MAVSKNSGKTPKMDGENRKTLLKWVIWGYHYFRKPSYMTSHFFVSDFFSVWLIVPVAKNLRISYSGIESLNQPNPFSTKITFSPRSSLETLETLTPPGCELQGTHEILRLGHHRCLHPARCTGHDVLMPGKGGLDVGDEKTTWHI